MTLPVFPPSQLLVLLLLLTPGVGLAAREPLVPPDGPDVPRVRQLPLAASSALPGMQERASLRLREDPGAQEQEASRPPRALRILAEVGAGLLTGVGGGFVGWFAGAGLCEAGVFGSSRGYLGCLEGTVGGMALGLSAAYSLGVFWGGEAARGNGKLLGALAGLGVGLVAGSLLSIAARQPYRFAAFALPFSLIGSHLGYELSQRAPALAGVAARPRLQPVLAFSQQGTLVGLGGRF